MNFVRAVILQVLVGLALSSPFSFIPPTAVYAAETGGYLDTCQIVGTSMQGTCLTGLYCLDSLDGIKRCKNCVEDGVACNEAVNESMDYCCGECIDGICQNQPENSGENSKTTCNLTVACNYQPPNPSCIEHACFDPQHPSKSAYCIGGSCVSCIPEGMFGCDEHEDCCYSFGDIQFCGADNICYTCIPEGVECTSNSECCDGATCKKATEKAAFGICTAPQGPVAEYTGREDVTIEEIFTLAYDILLPVAVAFGIYHVIKAGYVLKTSDGNPQRKQQGMEDLGAALIGTLFVGLSLTILKIIINSVLGGNVDF